MAKKALIYMTMFGVLTVSTLFAAGFGRNIQILRTMRNAPLMDLFYGVMCVVLIILLGVVVSLLNRLAEGKETK